MSPLRTASAIRARRRRGLVVDRRAPASAPPAARMARARPRQRASRPWLPICWLTHSARRTPGGGQAPAGLEPRALLGLADVGQHAEAAVDVAAGVDRDDRDAGLAPRGGSRGARPGSGIETTSPSGRVATAWSIRAFMRVDAVDVGRAVADDHVHLPRRRLDAVAHDRPERARRLPVRDDGDPHAAGRRPRAAAGGPRRAPGRAVTTTVRSCTTVVPPQPASRQRRAASARPRRAAAPSCRLCRRDGIRPRSRVPPPGGLSIASTPSTTASRSCSPRRPLPASSRRRPTPSSATSTTHRVARRGAAARATLAARARSVATLVSASATTK